MRNRLIRYEAILIDSIRFSLHARRALFWVELQCLAYACLFPVNGITAAAMNNGCATPAEQPVSQYCDAVKTLGVQSADTLHLNSDSQPICSEDSASLALLVMHTLPSTRLSDHPTVGLPKDLLLKISVLRI